MTRCESSLEESRLRRWDGVLRVRQGKGEMLLELCVLLSPTESDSCQSATKMLLCREIHRGIPEGPVCQ